MKNVAIIRRLFFYQGAHHAEQYRKKNGDVGYSPACCQRFSEACKAQGYRCDTCLGRELLPLTDERLEQHLAGKITLGAYQLRRDGTAGWGCLDIDADDDAEQSREHTKMMTRLLLARATGMGLPVVCEDTGNRGYHIWFFTPDGASAHMIQRTLAWMVNSIVEDEGEFAGIHVEVFPKQTDLTEGEFGNLVKIPLGLHKKTSRRCVLVNDDLEPLARSIDEQLEYLAQVKTITANELVVIMSEWVPDEPEHGILLQKNGPAITGPRPKGQGRLAWKTQDFIANGASGGTRNDRLFRAAADLAGNSYPQEEAVQMLMDAAVLSGLGKEETERTIASAYSKPRYPSVPENSQDWDEVTTDMQNARRFVYQHAGNARYCEPLGGWLTWDGSHWSKDNAGAVVQMAKSVVRGMLAEAANIPDEHERWGFIKSVRSCEAQSRIRAMLESASSEPEVLAHPEDFDADPWLLNVQNGTVDLRSGELRAHDREDMCTRLAPVQYTPGTTDPVLDAYLANATAKDPAFARYLQKAAGYTLTGLTDEETVFLVLGPGATGKSTLVEALIAMLGDYGVKTSFDTFLIQRNIGGARPDLVAMRGARMVAAVEPEKGRKLASSTLKEITGGDTISARDLYKAPFSFKPTFKIWLAANDSPELPDDDTGLWRRLHRLPFESVILPEARDPEVKKHLTSLAGGQAVLTWAVEGCLLWQTEKLIPPKVIREKTAELRRDFDPLAEFFVERCLVDGGVEVEATVLRRAYEEWAKDHGAAPIVDRDWSHRLKGMGCRRERRRRMGPPITLWIGIGLIATTNDQEDEDDDKPDFFAGTQAMPF